MIVEHAFITTKEEAEVEATARDLLSMLGFSPAVTPEGTADRLEFSRGRRHARQAIYNLERQPQRVRIEFDRGKVTVAASIEPHGKPHDLHRELLLTLATFIEARVAAGADPTPLRERWDDLHGRIRGHNRRARLPRNIILVLLGLCLAAMVVVVALAR
jgi:hypothetical protein